MSDRLTAWVRTTVPGLWAALVAYLVTLGLPAPVADALAGPGEQLVVAVVLAGTYAAVRWVEPRLPVWLTHLLLGSAKAPSYTPDRVGPSWSKLDRTA